MCRSISISPDVEARGIRPSPCALLGGLITLWIEIPNRRSHRDRADAAHRHRACALARNDKHDVCAKMPVTGYPVVVMRHRAPPRMKPLATDWALRARASPWSR